MGFKLKRVFKKAKKGLRKVGGALDKIDPTGISGMLATGGVSRGGVAGALISKGLGKGKKGGAAAAPGRERYKRRKRNQYVSKRQKAFNTKNATRSKRSGLGSKIVGNVRSKLKGGFAAAAARRAKTGGMANNDRLKKAASRAARSFF